MREIKFRYIWQQEETGYLIIKYLTLDDIQSPDTVFLIPKYGRPVIREQYTGLKDKKGKEIYEGDIVRDYDEGYLYKVIYNDYDAQFQFYDPVDDNYYSNNDLADHEIIGNIHEHNGLLN